MTVINIEDVKLADNERQECEIWSRVMGYYRPVSEFNKGKKSEFYSRKCFTEEKALRSMASCGCESIAAE